MLKLHKGLPKAKTPHEQESLRRAIEATDKREKSGTEKSGTVAYLMTAARPAAAFQIADCRLQIRGQGAGRRADG